MTGKLIMKKIITGILSVCMIFTMFPFVQNGINGSGQVEAASIVAAKKITYKCTGNQAKDIVGIAKTQKGYTPKSVRATAYGNFWGRQTDWCAMFACWCAYKAGLKNLGNEFTATGKRKKRGKFAVTADPDCFNGTYFKNGKKNPKVGDLVFYEMGLTVYTHEHVEIVTKVKTNSKGKVTHIKSIGGNNGGGPGTVRGESEWRSLSSSKTPLVIDFVRPNYRSTKCTSHNFKESSGEKKYNGKCQNSGCNVYYKDIDNAATSSASNNTRYYKLKAKTNVRSYPADNSRIDASGLAAGREIQVLGTVTVSGVSWYKVTGYGGTVKTGYVKTSEVIGPLVKNQASKLTGSISNITIKQGTQAPIKGSVSSNYVITKITCTINGRIESINITNDYRTSINIQDTKVGAALKPYISNLSGGTYSIKLEAWDLSNAKIEKTATVTVDGDVHMPTIGNEKAVESGKTITITSNVTGATLWYRIGDQEAKSTSNASVTMTITDSTDIVAWNVKSKESAKRTYYVDIPKLNGPKLEDTQEGDRVNVFMSSDANATIMYKVDSGSYTEYKGQVIGLNNGQVLNYYAKKIGCKNSDVETYKAEVTEPEAPDLRLLNTDSSVAVGKAATFGWNRDGKAAEYVATLYKTSDDSIEDVFNTTETVASFVIEEAGDYYVTVLAKNEIGESDPSNKVSVSIKAPLTVKFCDAGSNEEEIGDVLTEINVPYGDSIGDSLEEVLKSPSKRGHTFLGWENMNSGEISPNAFMKNIIKEDTIFKAKYEKKKYSIRFYDPDGEFITTNETAFEEDAVTDEVLSILADRGFINEGKVVKGWTVIRVADDDSKANVHAVDSNMHVQAVCEWGNENLPVVVTIMDEVKTEIDEDGDVVIRPRVRITTDESKKKEIYLIATIKGIDEATNTEKALYTDRRVFSIPKGEEGLVLNATSNSHDFDLPVEAKYTNAVAKLELVALEKKSNGTTGSTYSNVVESSITRDVGFTEPSAWMTTKPEEKEGRIITSKTQYRSRDKVYAYSGQEILSGYTKESEETLSTSYTEWYKGTGTSSLKRYDQYKEVVTPENRTAYKSFCKICSCGKWAAETKSGKCSYCGTNTITDRKLKVFSTQKLSGTKQSGTGNGGGAYKYGKTVTVGQTYSGIGYVYMITYGHTSIQRLNTFTSKNAKGYLYLWQDDDGTSTDVYRLRTQKIRNKFYKYTDWKDWDDVPINATATKQVEQRTVYQYQDKIQPPALEMNLVKDAGEVQSFAGNLNIEENLAGKIGTVMVYQANNTDPNKYQMQYTGQITFATDIDDENIGKNHYEFSFIPKDLISSSTGNYIVSIGVEGTTGLVTIGVIEAPKENHTVKLYYQGEDTENGGNKQIAIAEQSVKDGEDVDLSEVEIPERDGYYFAGWSRRTTNIKEDCEIEALYLPLQNAVAFVDWINQTVELRTAKTGEEINLPVIEADGGDSTYTFRGWKKEDGSIIEGHKVTVEGNMVITADYEPSVFNVTFIGVNGEIADTQQVNYHSSANPPEYTVPEGNGTFVGWSTSENWWRVEEDVIVRPIIVYDEQAIAPVSRIAVDEETEKRSVVLETEEQDAAIYYTTDGTYPTADLIQEYQQTDSEHYKGSIRLYTDPITLPEQEESSEETGELDTEDEITSIEIIAVSYVEGKDVSNECFELLDAEAVEKNLDISEDYDWEELGEYEVKSKAGKNINLKLYLDENPGLTGYDFLIEGDKEVFYLEEDEYGNPEVTKGELSEAGTLMTSSISDGWKVGWNSNKAISESGNLFTMTIHVNDDAEEGTYPIAVSYAPENTYNENYEPVKLDNVKVLIDSEASIQLDTLEISLSRTSYVYEGEEIEPTVKIEGLKEGEDYTVEYIDNVNVGTAKAVITGIGDYAGTVEKEFTITQANIANADIGEIEDVVKTGEAIEPEIPITFGTNSLEKDKDYEVTFQNNVEVGAATASIKGKGNFKGTTETSFNIIETLESRLAEAEKKLAEYQQALEDANTQIEQLEQAKETAETERINAETALNEAEENLRIAIEERNAALKDAEASEETIAELEQKVVDATAAKQTAETNLQTALQEKQDIEEKLQQAVSDKDTAEKNAEALKQELEEIRGTSSGRPGKQDNTESAAKTSISKAAVTAFGTKTFTGKAQVQNPSVKLNGKVLRANVDYIVRYTNNKNVGIATMTISGKGKYTGSIKKVFRILPKGTALTGVKKGKKKVTVKWKKQPVQITGYQIRYSTKANFASGVKMVTISKPTAKKKVIKKLKSKKKYYVQIRTFKKVNGKIFCSAWSKTKAVKVK